MSKTKTKNATASKDAKQVTAKTSAVKNCFQLVLKKVESATIKAYNTAIGQTVNDALKLYNDFQKEIIIREHNLISLASLSIEDFKKQIDALSKHVLRNYATAILLCLRFSVVFDAVTSTTLQALFKEITGKSISNLSKISETMYHFGLHGNCKYKTKEIKPNLQGKLYDTVAYNLFDCYPLAVKSAKIFTKIEQGKYYPIVANSNLYCNVVNSLGKEKIEYIMQIFYNKSFSDAQKELMKK